MASTFITPTIIASRGIATLYNTLILAGLVWRDFDADFAGKQGDTITVRKPAVFEAEQYDQVARTTDWQDTDEDSVAIKLDKLLHVPFTVTDEQMTLEVEDFDAQLLDPAMQAIAQGVDGIITEAMVDAAVAAANPSEGLEAGGGTIVQGSEPGNYPIRKLRERLTRNKLPLTDRHAALSPESATELLGDPLVTEVDKSGATAALREAIIGRLFGVETYETNSLGYGPGDRGITDGLGFHRSAFVLAVRPLQKPKGLATEQYSVKNGFGLSLRVIYTYDHDAKSDKITVDTLFGTKATRPEGIFKLDYGQGS